VLIFYNNNNNNNNISHDTRRVSWEKQQYPTKIADFRLTNPLPEGKSTIVSGVFEQQQMSLTRPKGQDV
jgi:hypothetical protein